MRNLNIFNELSEHITIKINSCYEYRDDNRWSESKIHNDYDIWLITSGSVSIKIQNVKYAAYTGDVVFFYPGVPYTASTDSENFSFIYIHFYYSIGNNGRVLEDFYLSGIISREYIQKETYLFRKGFEKYTASLSMSAMLLKGCLTILITKIMEIYGKGVNILCFPIEISQRETARNLNKLFPVFGYIDRNIQKPLRMDELAAFTGMSGKYFITYFKYSLGITPGQYIYQLKMNKAREYINQRKYSCKEIAFLLGYPDQYTFSKAFKKYYNVPPSKFI